MNQKVPESSIIDLDPLSTDANQFSNQTFDDYRNRCPVGWSGQHGGFWLMSRYQDVWDALVHHERFSAEHDLPEEVSGFPATGSGFRGVGIPEAPVRFLPSESDPPLTAAIRSLYGHLLLTPKAVANLEPSVEAATDLAIDAVSEYGRIDFCTDLGESVPNKAALRLIGLDPATSADFAPLIGVVCFTPTEPQYPHATLQLTQQRLTQLAGERRHAPRNDIASALTAGEILGKRLTDQQAATIMLALVIGGGHTVTSTLLHALSWLEGRFDVHKKLLEDPKLMANAVEEFIRWATPSRFAGRNVAQVMTLNGQTLERGDRVMLSLSAANHDPSKFECPHEIQIDRRNASQHVSFGSGAHRCLGMRVAQMELRVMLTRILRRIPDYCIERGGIVRAERTGQLNVILRMPASFTPFPR